MRRSHIVIFIGFIVTAPTLVAAESSDRNGSAGPSTRAAVRYRTDRFKAGGCATATEKTRGQKVCSAPRLSDPFVRQVQHSETSELPPLPPMLELAQADLLDDLLDTPEEPIVPESDLDDVLGDSVLQDPAPTTGEAETAPLTPPTPESLDGMPKRPLAIPVAGPLPAVPPAGRPPRFANQPFTLGGILDDEEDPNECLCEQMFCEQMWQCAGGRNIGWFKRWRRDTARNGKIWRGKANCLPNQMQNWECPYRQHGPQSGGDTCQTCQSGGGTHWSNLPPGATPMSEGEWEFSQNYYGPVGTSETISEPAYLDK